MRRFIKLWILLILLPTGLLAPRAPKPEKKHYPRCARTGSQTPR